MPFILIEMINFIGMQEFFDNFLLDMLTADASFHNKTEPIRHNKTKPRSYRNFVSASPWYIIHILLFQELEQIEEHYKQETRDLLSTVKRLQDENRKLASSLAAATERDSAFSEDGMSIKISRLQST